MRILAATTLMLAASAFASERQDQFADRFVPHWNATCRIPGHTIELTFDSRSGAPTEDDMVTSIRRDKQPPITLSLKPALFVAGKIKSAELGQCDNITGVLLKSGNILLLLRRDDRPSEDRLLAVLLNGKTGNVLDVINDLGAELDDTTLKRVPHGVRLRLIRSWQQISPRHEPIPVIELKTLLEKKGRLREQWEPAPQ